MLDLLQPVNCLGRFLALARLVSVALRQRGLEPLHVGRALGRVGHVFERAHRALQPGRKRLRSLRVPRGRGGLVRLDSRLQRLDGALDVAVRLCKVYLRL